MYIFISLCIWFMSTLKFQGAEVPFCLHLYNSNIQLGKSWINICKIQNSDPSNVMGQRKG